MKELMDVGKLKIATVKSRNGPGDNISLKGEDAIVYCLQLLKLSLTASCVVHTTCRITALRFVATSRCWLTLAFSLFCVSRQLTPRSNLVKLVVISFPRVAENGRGALQHCQTPTQNDSPHRSLSHNIDKKP